MTLDHNGNLLVGKTSADDGAVAGIEAQAGGSLYIAKNATNLHLNRLTSDGDIAVFRKDGTTVGSIGTSQGSLYSGSGNVGLLYRSAFNAIYPSDSSGSFSKDASIDIGGTTQRFKDLYLSGDVFVNKTTKTATGSGIVLDGNGFAYFVRDGAVQILVGNDDTGGTSQEAIRFVRNTSDVGSIDTTSTATSYNTSSDYRLKNGRTAHNRCNRPP